MLRVLHVPSGKSEMKPDDRVRTELLDLPAIAEAEPSDGAGAGDVPQ